jgi:bifunctional DNase/RNase
MMTRGRMPRPYPGASARAMGYGIREMRSGWLCALALLASCRPAETESAETGVARIAQKLHDERAVQRTQQEPERTLEPPAEPTDVGPPAVAPEGYMLMKPISKSGAFGNAVLLVDATEEVFVPIYIGGTEALSIQLRLEHQRYARPLTHDLFDAFAGELGARMVRAQVDRLQGDIYIGTVVFERAGKTFTLDARPSDAIALAIGNRVPIFVSKQLVAAVGIRPEDLERADAKPRSEPTAL